jgi:hypothetical protein
MAVKVTIFHQHDSMVVDWAVKNCSGFLYAVTTDEYSDIMKIELFFKDSKSALLFNLRYF